MPLCRAIAGPAFFYLSRALAATMAPDCYRYYTSYKQGFDWNMYPAVMVWFSCMGLIPQKQPNNALRIVMLRC